MIDCCEHREDPAGHAVDVEDDPLPDTPHVVAPTELEVSWRSLADPMNDCDACGAGLPGVLAPQFPDGDESHCFVECCDSCQRFESDDAAALALAVTLGWRFHRRYDDVALKCWHPFVTPPGAFDDHDFYCLASETGSFTGFEVKVGE